jgi:hypothetical protein
MMALAAKARLGRENRPLRPVGFSSTSAVANNDRFTCFNLRTRHFSESMASTAVQGSPICSETLLKSVTCERQTSASALSEARRAITIGLTIQSSCLPDANRPIVGSSSRNQGLLCSGREEKIQSTSLLNTKMDQRGTSALILQFCRTAKKSRSLLRANGSGRVH